MHESKILNLH